MSYRESEENGLEHFLGKESAGVDDVDGGQLGEEGELGKLPNQDEDARQERNAQNLKKE